MLVRLVLLEVASLLGLVLTAGLVAQYRPIREVDPVRVRLLCFLRVPACLALYLVVYSRARRKSAIRGRFCVDVGLVMLEVVRPLARVRTHRLHANSRGCSAHGRHATPSPRRHCLAREARQRILLEYIRVGAPRVATSSGSRRPRRFCSWHSCPCSSF